jgi:hypothetical protein
MKRQNRLRDLLAIRPSKELSMSRIVVGSLCNAALLCTLVARTAFGHPSAGIVVDEQGQVYFSDLSRGVMKIGREGEITV